MFLKLRRHFVNKFDKLKQFKLFICKNVMVSMTEQIWNIHFFLPI